MNWNQVFPRFGSRRVESSNVMAQRSSYTTALTQLIASIIRFNKEMYKQIKEIYYLFLKSELIIFNSLKFLVYPVNNQR